MAVAAPTPAPSVPTRTSVPAIRLRHVGKTFARDGQAPLRVLDDITLDIAQGEVVAILGTSGCGKSTLLNLIAGLASTDQGDIELDGTPVAAFENWSTLGYLFQDDRLLPWRTTLDNVAFGLENGPLPRAQRRERARQALREVGLRDFESAYPHALSGGMRSRAALARSLVSHPRVLLLDEPFSKLDPATRTQLHTQLLALHDANRMTTVFVTHDVEEAVVLADRVVVLQPRPGRVHRVLDIDLPRPRDATDPRVSEQVRRLRTLL